MLSKEEFLEEKKKDEELIKKLKQFKDGDELISLLPLFFIEFKNYEQYVKYHKKMSVKYIESKDGEEKIENLKIENENLNIQNENQII